MTRDVAKGGAVAKSAICMFITRYVVVVQGGQLLHHISKYINIIVFWKVCGGTELLIIL